MRAPHAAARVALACPALAAPLMALADRVGQNREIAGVHFPSDRHASERIAAALFPVLAAGREFRTVLAGAETELAGLVTYPTTAIGGT